MDTATERLLDIPNFLRRKLPKRQRLKEEDSTVVLKQIGPNKFTMHSTQKEHPGKKIKMPKFIWRRQRKKYKTTLQVQNLKKLGWLDSQIPAITEEQATFIIARGEDPVSYKKRKRRASTKKRAHIKKKTRAVLRQRAALKE